MEEEDLCRMSFDNAELQVPVKHPRGNRCTNLKLKGEEVSWIDVRITIIEKAIKAMEYVR